MGTVELTGLEMMRTKALRAELCNALDKSLNNTGVDLEEVVTGHSRLAWLD